MKTRSKTPSFVGPAILLALFTAGSVAARALAPSFPAPLMGLLAALLGLRIGVMAAAIHDPPVVPTRAVMPDAGEREPLLRAANG